MQTYSLCCARRPPWPRHLRGHRMAWCIPCIGIPVYRVIAISKGWDRRITQVTWGNRISCHLKPFSELILIWSDSSFSSFSFTSVQCANSFRNLLKNCGVFPLSSTRELEIKLESWRECELSPFEKEHDVI